MYPAIPKGSTIWVHPNAAKVTKVTRGLVLIEPKDESDQRRYVGSLRGQTKDRFRVCQLTPQLTQRTFSKSRCVCLKIVAVEFPINEAKAA
jgi:hypothetical protein